MKLQLDCTIAYMLYMCSLMICSRYKKTIDPGCCDCLSIIEMPLPSYTYYREILQKCQNEIVYGRIHSLNESELRQDLTICFQYFQNLSSINHHDLHVYNRSCNGRLKSMLPSTACISIVCTYVFNSTNYLLGHLMPMPISSNIQKSVYLQNKLCNGSATDPFQEGTCSLPSTSATP